MKKTLLFASLFALTMCMALVSCSKDEDDQKPQTTVPTGDQGDSDDDPDNDPDDLSRFNIMLHNWTLSEIVSPDMDPMLLAMINQGIGSGNIFITFSGVEDGEESNYAGWTMSMSYGSTPLMSYDVVSYSPATQELQISSNGESFTTVVQIDDGEDRVYMTLNAAMPLTGSNMSIVAYTMK